MISTEIEQAYLRSTQTLNVVYIENGTLSSIVSFPGIDEHVVHAENLFIHKIESYLGEKLDAEDTESYIEEGSFTSETGEVDILLVWSL